nr:MAG TPA: hypothetical protein [Caudoviricetes sp.]
MSRVYHGPQQQQNHLLRCAQQMRLLAWENKKEDTP